MVGKPYLLDAETLAPNEQDPSQVEGSIPRDPPGPHDDLGLTRGAIHPTLIGFHHVGEKPIGMKTSLLPSSSSLPSVRHRSRPFSGAACLFCSDATCVGAGTKLLLRVNTWTDGVDVGTKVENRNKCQ